MRRKGGGIREVEEEEEVEEEDFPKNEKLGEAIASFFQQSITALSSCRAVSVR